MFASYNNGTVTFDAYYGDFFTAAGGTVLPVTMVTNFDWGDYIDLAVVPPVTTPVSVKITPVFNGEVIDHVAFFFNSSFEVQTGSDGEGGVYVQAPPVFAQECVAGESMIAGPDGERPAQSLRVGDLILCYLSGVPRARAVVARHAWHCDVAAAPQRRAVAPVRIAAGAFADGVPRRELLLSPDHAIHADGMLVPARHLINGLSIVQDCAQRSISYVHVEVESHDVMAAEGLLVETRLPQAMTARPRQDAASRQWPAGRWSQAWDAQGCAPLVVTGAPLDALRGRLFARATRLGLIGGRIDADPGTGPAPLPRAA